MKTFLLALFIATPIFAAPVRTDNLVVPLGAAPQILLPAAGSVQGANGTFFRSDINLVNYSSHDQTVELRWLPQFVTGNGVSVKRMTISALSGVNSEDFVGSVMQQSGLGSILITGISIEGAGDPTAVLYATSRIWSNQPGLSNGTVSQTFSAIPAGSIHSTRLSIIGLRRDARYRLNVGVVNLDAVNEQRFQIVVRGTSASVAEVTFVTVPPLSMVQSSFVGPPLDNVQIAIDNVSASARSNTWTAYGSSVDNTTGDGWSEIGYIAPPDQAAP
jgi:hypothetical protein